MELQDLCTIKGREVLVWVWGCSFDGVFYRVLDVYSEGFLVVFRLIFLKDIMSQNCFYLILYGGS